MKKFKIICFVVTLIFACSLVSIIVTIRNDMNLTESNTSEYTATISSILLSSNDANSNAVIITNEYACALYLKRDILENQEILKQLQNLTRDQQIVFRIPEGETELLNSAGFVTIVALEEKTTCIFSLTDYNNCMRVTMRPMLITSFFAEALFILGAILFGRSIFFKKEKKN